MYKVIGTESCSGGDTQEPAAAASQVAHSQAIKIPHPPSASLLYTVINNEVKQQSLGWGVTLKQEKPGFLLLSLNVNNLGKAAVLHFALAPSEAGAMPNSVYRSLSTTALMSSSHRLLIIHSPHLHSSEFYINETILYIVQSLHGGGGICFYLLKIILLRIVHFNSIYQGHVSVIDFIYCWVTLHYMAIPQFIYVFVG
jgi:hypothetical protein